METQRVIPVKESEVRKGVFEIIEVPESEVDTILTWGRLGRKEKIKTVGQKVSYLRDILICSMDNQDYVLGYDFENYIKTVEDVFAANESRFSDYVNAQLAENLIRERVPMIKRISIDEKTNTRDEDIKEFLTDNFKKTKGKKICISTSHGATWFSLEAVHESRENESIKTAVIVFDNHVDIYGDGVFDFMVTKGNVFRLLGNDGVIERATFIGGLGELGMINRGNEKAKQEGKTVEYKQIPIGYLKPEKVTDRLKLLRELDKTIKQYKLDGITNVVFSVDMDVLNAGKIGYTGFEYNPMETLSHISLLHLPLDKDPSELTQREVNYIAREAVSQIWFEDLNYYHPKGLALGDVGISLDAIPEYCKKYGLNFGVKLTGGGIYFGDVVEMSGLDYKGRTATASVALLKRIERIVQGQ